MSPCLDVSGGRAQKDAFSAVAGGLNTYLPMRGNTPVTGRRSVASASAAAPTAEAKAEKAEANAEADGARAIGPVAVVAAADVAGAGVGPLAASGATRSRAFRCCAAQKSGRNMQHKHKASAQFQMARESRKGVS